MIQAVGKHIVCMRWESRKNDTGSLLLPDISGQLELMVIATGAEVDNVVDRGNLIFVHPMTPYTIWINEEEYLVVNEENVLAVYRDE